MKHRLNKFLATCGIASRRASEVLIRAGRVRVNGKVTLLPQTSIDDAVDKVTLDGKLIGQEKKQYFALHKPIGYTCTNAATTKRRVVNLIESGSRLYTIGRLDKDTSGLILLTNDGHFAHHIMHPSFEISKEYVVKVDNEVSHEHLQKISAGCRVQGKLVRPVSVKKVRKSTIRITVKEGRYHEVRDFIAAANLKVIELKRVRIGSLLLGNLPVGAWKELSQKEVASMFPMPSAQETPKTLKESRKTGDKTPSEEVL
jgi:23S rRNA pseudouridine2605 synthase